MTAATALHRASPGLTVDPGLRRDDYLAMIAFVLQRLMQAMLVMLVVALIAFALFNFVGDPINSMV